MFSSTFTISTLSILVALAAAACSPAELESAPAQTRSAQASLLEGRTYVTDAPLSDGTAIRSELTFANGMLDSSACAKLGYLPGAYRVSFEGDTIVFRAQLRATDGRSEVWTGRIVGDSMTGYSVGADGFKIAFTGKRSPGSAPVAASRSARE